MLENCNEERTGLTPSSPAVWKSIVSHSQGSIFEKADRNGRPLRRPFSSRSNARSWLAQPAGSLIVVTRAGCTCARGT